MLKSQIKTHVVLIGGVVNLFVTPILVNEEETQEIRRQTFID